MPDEKGRPTAEELEAHSATLQQLIDEARALQSAVSDELRRLRRANRTPSSSSGDRQKTSR